MGDARGAALGGAFFSALCILSSSVAFVMESRIVGLYRGLLKILTIICAVLVPVWAMAIIFNHQIFVYLMNFR